MNSSALLSIRNSIYKQIAGETIPVGRPEIAEWNAFRGDKVPFVIKTGPMNLEDPDHMKYFRRIDFYGKGQVHVKAYVDHRLVCDAHAEMISDPKAKRSVMLPRTSKGLEIDLMLSVDGVLEGYEIMFEVVGGE